MQSFLIIVSYFINIGIVFHILKFVSGVGLHFLINDEKGTRKLYLTLRGKPVLALVELAATITEKPSY